jgi:hypothetical protein
MASVILAGARTPFGKFVANELKRRGLRTGAAALCGGGGQSDALVVRRPQK